MKWYKSPRIVFFFSVLLIMGLLIVKAVSLDMTVEKNSPQGPDSSIPESAMITN
ncbi:MAG: hypothetical protein GY754_20705 [bacterium]|nr:hypothetical protein [bacterium]